MEIKDAFFRNLHLQV